MASSSAVPVDLKSAPWNAFDEEDVELVAQVIDLAYSSYGLAAVEEEDEIGEESHSAATSTAPAKTNSIAVLRVLRAFEAVLRTIHTPTDKHAKQRQARTHQLLMRMAKLPVGDWRQKLRWVQKKLGIEVESVTDDENHDPNVTESSSKANTSTTKPEDSANTAPNQSFMSQNQNGHIVLYHNHPPPSIPYPSYYSHPQFAQQGNHTFSTTFPTESSISFLAPPSLQESSQILKDISMLSPQNDVLIRAFRSWRLWTRVTRQKKAELVNQWVEAIQFWQRTILRRCIDTWASRALIIQNKRKMTLGLLVLRKLKFDTIASRRISDQFQQRYLPKIYLKKWMNNYRQHVYQRDRQNISEGYMRRKAQSNILKWCFQAWKHELTIHRTARQVALNVDTRIQQSTFQFWRSKTIRQIHLRNCCETFEQRSLQKTLESLFCKWRKFMQLTKRERELKQRKTLSLLRRPFQIWQGRIQRHSQMEQQAARYRLASVFKRWKLWEKKTKAPKRKLVMFQQDHHQRHLYALFETWRELTKTRRYLNPLGKAFRIKRTITTLRNTFNLWLSTTRQHRMDKQNTLTFQHKSQLLRLKSAMNTWKYRYYQKLLYRCAERQRVASFFRRWKNSYRRVTHDLNVLHLRFSRHRPKLVSGIFFRAWVRRYAHLCHDEAKALAVQKLNQMRVLLTWRKTFISQKAKEIRADRTYLSQLLVKSLRKWSQQTHQRAASRLAAKISSFATTLDRVVIRQRFHDWRELTNRKKMLRLKAGLLKDNRQMNTLKTYLARWKLEYGKKKKFCLTAARIDRNRTLRIYWDSWSNIFSLRRRVKTAVNIGEPVIKRNKERVVFKKWLDLTRKVQRLKYLETRFVMRSRLRLTIKVMSHFRTVYHNRVLEKRYTNWLQHKRMNTMKSHLLKWSRVRKVVRADKTFRANTLRLAWNAWKGRWNELQQDALSTRLYYFRLQGLAFRKWLWKYRAAIMDIPIHEDAELSAFTKDGLRMKKSFEMAPKYVKKELQPNEITAYHHMDPLSQILHTTEVMTPTTQSNILPSLPSPVRNQPPVSPTKMSPTRRSIVSTSPTRKSVVSLSPTRTQFPRFPPQPTPTPMSPRSATTLSPTKKRTSLMINTGQPSSPTTTAPIMFSKWQEYLDSAREEESEADNIHIHFFKRRFFRVWRYRLEDKRREHQSIRQVQRLVKIGTLKQAMRRITAVLEFRRSRLAHADSVYGLSCQKRIWKLWTSKVNEKKQMVAIADMHADEVTLHSFFNRWKRVYDRREKQEYYTDEYLRGVYLHRQHGLRLAFLHWKTKKDAWKKKEDSVVKVLTDYRLRLWFKTWREKTFKERSFNTLVQIFRRSHDKKVLKGTLKTWMSKWIHVKALHQIAHTAAMRTVDKRIRRQYFKRWIAKYVDHRKRELAAIKFWRRRRMVLALTQWTNELIRRHRIKQLEKLVSHLKLLKFIRAWRSFALHCQSAKDKERKMLEQRYNELTGLTAQVDIPNRILRKRIILSQFFSRWRELYHKQTRLIGSYTTVATKYNTKLVKSVFKKWRLNFRFKVFRQYHDYNRVKKIFEFWRCYREKHHFLNKLLKHITKRKRARRLRRAFRKWRLMAEAKKSKRSRLELSNKNHGSASSFVSAESFNEHPQFSTTSSAVESRRKSSHLIETVPIVSQIPTLEEREQAFQEQRQFIIADTWADKTLKRNILSAWIKLIR